MATVLGLDAKLYRNAGSYASPSWQLIGNVKDLTLNLEMGEADVTSRAAEGWRQTEPTLADASLEWGMVWDPDDAQFTAIQEAFFARTAIEFLALDGLVATSGSQGLRFTGKIFSFSRDENLEEALMVNVTAKPSYDADNPPEWHEVS